jgi:pimeloyl-ACP methyl ester carboxylesterase
VRLIAPDRPGAGASDPQPGHRIADWAEDVAALADALGLVAFGVIGWSAGVPYVLAWAALAPARVNAVAITSSGSSLACLLDDDAALRDEWLEDGDRAILDALRESRESAERLSAAQDEGWVRSIQRDPGSVLATLTSAGSRRVLADPATTAGLTRSVVEYARQGSRALAPQYVGLLAPWGFRPEDVEAEVHLWLGDEDEMASPDRMRKLATRIPRHVVTVWDDAGHLAIVEHMDEVLAGM